MDKIARNQEAGRAERREMERRFDARMAEIQVQRAEDRRRYGQVTARSDEKHAGLQRGLDEKMDRIERALERMKDKMDDMNCGIQELETGLTNMIDARARENRRFLVGALIAVVTAAFTTLGLILS